MNTESALPIKMLKSEAARLKVDLTDEQAKQLDIYGQMLIEYNKHTNLVGNAEPQCLLYEHVLDSLALVPIIDRLESTTAKSQTTTKQAQPMRLIDIGTGAGFPGLVLALAKVDLNLVAVDATSKKTIFLQRVVQALGLNERVEVIQARAEELAHNSTYRASFHYATCRALGALPIVCELTLPFLEQGGYALLQRGNKQIETEKDSAKKLAAKLGATFVESILLDSAVLHKDHYVLVLRQQKQAPSKFPRSWKEIKDWIACHRHQ